MFGKKKNYGVQGKNIDYPPLLLRIMGAIQLSSKSFRTLPLTLPQILFEYPFEQVCSKQ